MKFNNALLLAGCATAAPSVSITNGTVVGVHLDSFDQDIFLGIPYAQPPVGSLRFAPPKPYNESWDDVFVADEYGSACWSTSGIDSAHFEHSEDCLTINVVRPNGNFSDLPVAFWIHGGGFADGTGGRPAYNMSFIIQNAVDIGKPFIGVSINYRLAPFGFWSSNALTQKGWTNVGLRDQIQAINWVRENIEAFGGDPDHIVIWGESAGAISVGKLMTSGKVPFIKGAIMESGSAVLHDIWAASVPQYEDDFENVVDYFNCTEASDVIECLQDVDEIDLQYAFNITNGIMKYTPFPVVDGDIIPKSGYDSYANGEFTKIPILIGDNTDEGNAFTPTTIVDFASFYTAAKSTFPHLTNTSLNTIYELYTSRNNTLSPLQPSYDAPNTGLLNVSDIYRYVAPFFGDAYFIAPSRFVAEFTAEAGLPVYKYRHNIPNSNNYNLTYVFGATHYTEVAYVFYTGQEDNGFRDSSDGQKWWNDDRYEEISKTISEMWAGFITDLDPNVADTGIEWSSYMNQPKNLVFDIDGFYQEADNFRADHISFIRDIHSQFVM